MKLPKSLKKALEEAAKLSKRDSEAGRWAKSIHVLLEATAEEIDTMVQIRSSTRGTGQIRYVVEKTQQGEVLSELRLGGKSKPFRCPKGVYEALMAVIFEAGRPLPLDEIMSALEKRMGDRPPEHQIRVSLRFWLTCEPPLIIRSRARYRSDNLANLIARAKALWSSLNSPD